MMGSSCFRAQMSLFSMSSFYCTNFKNALFNLSSQIRVWFSLIYNHNFFLKKKVIWQLQDEGNHDAPSSISPRLPFSFTVSNVRKTTSPCLWYSTRVRASLVVATAYHNCKLWITDINLMLMCAKLRITCTGIESRFVITFSFQQETSRVMVNSLMPFLITVQFMSVGEWVTRPPPFFFAWQDCNETRKLIIQTGVVHRWAL
jgi:hypothetical protein